MVEVRSIYTIIKSLVLTEKNSSHLGNLQYVFMVDKTANKIEIRNAVEKVYKVKVKDVQTMTVKGKTKRLRWGQEGKTASWKKAIVRLQPGHEIKTI